MFRCTNRLVPAWAAALCFAALPALAEWGEQTLELQPGWNAVFLEVQPDDNSCEAVFQDLPVESVWLWNRRFTPEQFVRNPAELRPENPDWLTYFPVDSPKSFLTDLYAVYAGRSYLIEVGSSTPVSLVLQGKVLVRKRDWLANALNLVGFHVDAASPPTFKNFFAGQKALDGQKIYRITQAGMAQEVNPQTDQMRRGESYWVYCNGESSYSGPLSVEYDMPDGLQFGESMTEQSLRLTNESTTQRTVTLRMLPASAPSGGEKSAAQSATAGPVELSYLSFLKWEPLTEPLQMILPPGSAQQIDLAVRRAAMSAPGDGKAVFASLLEVSDGAGQTYRIPVSAEKINSDGGLWAGTVTLSKVSEAANPTNLTTPTPAAGDFSFRIIVHIDGTGSARLLQSVAIMQVQPELNQDGSVKTPSRFVLVTDESKVAQYTGVARRDGQVVGRRITSPVFDFRTPQAMAEVAPNVLEATLTTDYQNVTNPFVHRFHPDHDNLTERYDATLAEGKESFTFQRKVRLEFQDQDPEQLSLPDWGYNLIGGKYRETITGVHRNPVVVEGTFRLSRVSDVLELNDGQ